MTPALVDLARRYMGLTGAPVRDMVADELVCPNDPGGYPRFRDVAGILWAPDPDNALAPWLPDFDDDATGILMLRGLPAVRTIEMDPDDVTLTVFTGGGYVTGRGDTLAEAVADVAVAMGRAG